MKTGRFCAASFAWNLLCLALLLGAEGDGKEVEVVIAEDGDGVSFQRAHETQHFQGLRAPVDQVADKPDLVAVSREVELHE